MPRILIAAIMLFVFSAVEAQAQIVPPISQNGGTRVSSLQETLVNNLRATLPEQQEFITKVRKNVADGKLETGMVLATMRYAQRRNGEFPFPFFERAMRFQAAKQGVALPAVAIIRSTNPR